MEINKAIEIYFKKKGKDLVDKLKSQLRKKKKVASGKTVDSISFSTYQEGDKQTLVIEANEDIAYIIGGRSKGQSPPIKEIQEWAKSKDINKNAAWAIAKDLKENPIKGVSLTSFTKREDQQIFEELQELIANAEEENILNDLTAEIKNPGVIIK